MATTAPAALQTGLPDIVPNLLGIAGSLVLLLIVIAIAGTIYKHLSGGIEWPEDREHDDDTVSRGDQDDEWDYY